MVCRRVCTRSTNPEVGHRQSHHAHWEVQYGYGQVQTHAGECQRRGRRGEITGRSHQERVVEAPREACVFITSQRNK